ncbi:MAG: alpha/beta fold hydrolase [Chloroflexota bacterium]|jgi:class 3 adenylate cyclase/pimeloyl-ACP methyl ester carboxylesterase
MDQHIHFCKTQNGVQLAYATIGHGPPLVKAANWLSHLEYDWHSPVWRHWLEGLAESHQLFRYDERGCGLSDWDVDDFSLEAWVQDLETVVDAVGVQRFPLLGISQGGPIAITYAVRHPERVSHLILYGSYVRGKLHRNLPPEKVQEVEMLGELIRLGWGQESPAFRQVFTTLFIPEGTPEQWSWFNELQHVSASPENAYRIYEGFNYLNVSHLAPKVVAPTLILHAEGDGRIPLEEGRRIASLIPNARFVPLKSNNHILLRAEPAWEQFLSQVRDFLGVKQENVTPFVPAKDHGVVDHYSSAGVLFADMVGFTTLSTEMAPDEIVRLLDKIYSRFDNIVEQYGLQKIRVVGDEYMVASGVPRPRPDHALALADAALDMVAYLATLPAYNQRRVTFRFGLNIGPVTAGTVGRVKLQYDLWGDTVNIASRMQAHGVPGKIQITRAMYEQLEDQYICQPRGKTVIKDKGEMETWFLIDRAEDRP